MYAAYPLSKFYYNAYQEKNFKATSTAIPACNNQIKSLSQVPICIEFYVIGNHKDYTPLTNTGKAIAFVR